MMPDFECNSTHNIPPVEYGDPLFIGNMYECTSRTCYPTSFIVDSITMAAHGFYPEYTKQAMGLRVLLYRVMRGHASNAG